MSTTMHISFECEDEYEAEKLASLIGIQKDKASYLAGVATVIKNEIVLQLKDKSHHAVMLKNERGARELQSILQDVVDGKRAITESSCNGSCTEITLKQLGK